MHLQSVRCTGCGSGQVVAVEPGDETVKGSLFVLKAGRPDKCWCERCWQQRFGQNNTASATRKRPKPP